MTARKNRYHHGDLKASLLKEASLIIDDTGPESLSLRGLAERTGVSRSALYHHFSNKDDLLAALAAEGFCHLYRLLDQSVQTSPREQVTKAVKGYLEFAVAHPAQYSLMFGRALWHKENETPFQRQAKDCFRFYVSLFAQLQQSDGLWADESPLRLAQIMWSSLHGLAKLINDGIVSTGGDYEELSETLVNRFF